MPEKLKPCPFCGADAELGISEIPAHDGGHYIQCTKCQACTSLVYAIGDDPSPILAEKWNRRTREFLADKHKGMRVDHSGILGRIAQGCKVRPDQRFILGEMDKHLEEMARRFYTGDIVAVDEFLQLYGLDDHRPGDAA